MMVNRGFIQAARILFAGWVTGTCMASADKTLVAWVSPSNMTQRGGSVLTVERNNVFDAIVFGEKRPGVWMAGSDRYARTQQDQGEYPAESAPLGTVIQVAIVYKGDEVHIYRNGLPYASYSAKPVSLLEGDKGYAVFGLRHLEAMTGEPFAGAIDDARIYASALTSEQLKSLRPNLPSTPQPLAWWDFEGVSATDRMGYFTHHLSVGGAGLKDGRLVLDGRGYVVAARKEEDLSFKHASRSAGTPQPVTKAITDFLKVPANPPSTWLTYHLAHPGPSHATPGDPNPAFFYKGRYHLHYIYNNHDGFAFAHVSSTDMVHWVWHPTTLSPSTTGHGMFSGTGFFTKNGTPAMIYHGQGMGKNVIAFGLDDQLEEWSPPYPVEPLTEKGAPAVLRHWDPDCWRMGDRYYAISGGNNPQLMRSSNLMQWIHLGDLFHAAFPDDLGVAKAEDVSCANMFKLGDRWMLLCISHALGARYYLGEFRDEKFLPSYHAMLNWARWDCFAPESFLAEDGRRIMVAWCTPAVNGMQRQPRQPFDRLTQPRVLQQGIQCLPRELTLSPEKRLKIKPIRELESLRYDQIVIPQQTVRADVPTLLERISGEALELEVRIAPSVAKACGVRLFCDERGNGGFTIEAGTEKRTLDVGYSHPPFEWAADEEMCLRIFIDKSMVEVFANDRQAVVAWHEFDSTNKVVSLFSKGTDTVFTSVKAWKMKSIYKGGEL